MSHADLPSPDEVRRSFAQLEATAGADRAVRYLYELGLFAHYIKADDVARNICWTAPGAYGELELTINLSKPEKDPRAIAACACATGAGGSPHPECSGRPTPAAPAANASRCDLCWENEGYPGDANRPAKPGLRIAAIQLGGEPWGLQFSPYAYFDEHCIALSREHRPMKVDGAAVARLLDFVDRFPFYFAGSNADLPIVGGSILSHDHYQGGRHVFPLMKAPVERPFALAGCPDVQAGAVAWPATTVRLASCDRAPLQRAAEHVLAAWRSYSDPSVHLVARDADGTPHNAANPIARKLPDGTYVLDLILRNNCTTTRRPWGLFHPGEELHHIKRENIGLIEAMGMAILPPRLARELPLVQQALYAASLTCDSPNNLLKRLQGDASVAPHASWAADVFRRRNACLLAEAQAAQAQGVPSGRPLGAVLEEEVAHVFERVLETVGVFKRNANGFAARDRFIDHLTYRTAGHAAV